MAESIYVNDLREEGDSTFSLVPRCTSLADLEQHFAVQVDRSLGWDVAPAGQPVYKLVGFSVRHGPSFFCKVVRANGQPFQTVLIAAHYPNFPSNDHTWSNPVPAYFPRAFGDFTNAEGVWGLPVGGLTYDPDRRYGPLSLWPNSNPDRYADMVTNLGWYPLTPHLAVHPEWMYCLKEGGTTPPPAEGEYRLVNVGPGGEMLGYLVFMPGAPAADQERLSLVRGNEELGHLMWQKA